MNADTGAVDEKLEVSHEALAEGVRRALSEATDGKFAAACAQSRSISTEMALADLLERVRRLECEVAAWRRSHVEARLERIAGAFTEVDRRLRSVGAGLEAVRARLMTLDSLVHALEAAIAEPLQEPPRRKWRAIKALALTKIGIGSK